MRNKFREDRRGRGAGEEGGRGGGRRGGMGGMRSRMEMKQARVVRDKTPGSEHAACYKYLYILGSH